MTRDDVRSVLAQVTYRPGWEFRIAEDPYEGLAVWVVAPVENSYQPGTTTDLGIETFVPLASLAGPEQFLEWLLARLVRLETHEAMEWFKVNGKPFRDPHAARTPPQLELAL
jgi:hypothetical protein